MDLNIFLPDTPSVLRDSQTTGYVIEISENLWGIFIIDSRGNRKIADSKIRSRFDLQIDENNVIKCDIVPNENAEKLSNEYKNYLNILMKDGKFSIRNLTINGKKFNVESDIRKSIFLLYDHREFSETEVLFPSLYSKTAEDDAKTNENVNQFYILKSLLSMEIETNHHFTEVKSATDKTGFSLFFVKYLIGYSRLFSHLSNILKFIYQIFFSIWKERKVSVKTGNFLAALLLDLSFGIIILYWINQQFPNLENDFFILIEDIISYLKTLLSWLMGSPAGLKLNRTFNNLLGKFFLNNIDLWWKFLEISKDVLELSLQIFKYLGMFGVTFQAAIIADMLAFASLHIYCIYIYAARLYNVQISAIIALLRLFLGKKYNPLRGCVDTCHYNYHQLFIGTLGFTILLFLLPTTLMYYFVFTIFRILILVLMEVLSRTQINILSLPIFSFILWICKSPKIAGNLHVTIEPKMAAQSNLVVLLVKLKSIPLSQMIKIHKSIPIQQSKKIKWIEILTKLCVGNLLCLDTNV